MESSGSEGQRRLELIAGGMNRRELTQEERDDARQVLTLAIAACSRERAAADQYYARGRNLWVICATLFTAIQAAFLANVGRRSGSNILLTAHERGDIVWWAVGAGVLLAISLGLLLGWLDRPRTMRSVGAQALTDAWLDPEKKYAERAVLEVLAARAIQEEAGWADANKDRKRALSFLAWSCGLTALVSVVELMILYMHLT
jgi:hypothetical protein